jgi:hypothetical protein
VGPWNRLDRRDRRMACSPGSAMWSVMMRVTLAMVGVCLIVGGFDVIRDDGGLAGGLVLLGSLATWAGVGDK